MTPADMRENAAQVAEAHFLRCGSMSAAEAIRALSIPEAPLPGIDLEAVERRAATPGDGAGEGPGRWTLGPGDEHGMCVVWDADGDIVASDVYEDDAAHIAGMDPSTTLTLCAALRSVTAERDALRRAVEEARGQRDIARSEAGRCHDMLRERDGAICEAREQLRQWERMAGPGHPLRRPVADALAALTHAGQERAEPEEPSEDEETDALACINCGWAGASNIDHDAYQWSPEGDLLCPDCGHACGASAPVRTERECPEPVPTPEEMANAAGLDGAAGSAGLFADGVRAQRALGWPVIAPERDHEKRYRLMRADAERVIAQVIAERDEFEAAHLAALATNGALQRERDEARERAGRAEAESNAIADDLATMARWRANALAEVADLERTLAEYRNADRERKDVL